MDFAQKTILFASTLNKKKYTLEENDPLNSICF